MEKEENQNKSDIKDNQTIEVDSKLDQNENFEKKENIKVEEPTPEEKIIELEDKLTRTFAEMENQRRRFEKEKEDAFEYGGFSFAKEALNLIDNLERSKTCFGK